MKEERKQLFLFIILFLIGVTLTFTLIGVLSDGRYIGMIPISIGVYIFISKHPRIKGRFLKRFEKFMYGTLFLAMGVFFIFVMPML